MSQHTLETGKPLPIALDMFNLSHVRVAGGAGLGLVAISAIVAVTIPAIGVPLGIGGVLSAVAAVVMIRRRQAVGPLPSGTSAMGANTTFGLDEPGPESRRKSS